MKAEHVKTLEKASATLAISTNAAKATLEEVRLAFPSKAAITNQAEAVCKVLLKAAREEFNDKVRYVVIEATKINTISI